MSFQYTMLTKGLGGGWLKYFIASLLFFSFKFSVAQYSYNEHYNYQELQLNRNKPKEIQKNKSAKFHLDSIVDYRFRKDLNKYVRTSKYIFYDVGKVNHSVKFSYSGNKVNINSEDKRQYDDKGRVLFWSSKTYSSANVLGYSDSVYYIYNDSSLRYSYRFAMMNEDYNDTSKTYNLFDAENRNIKSIRYKYNNTLNTWDDDLETQNEYNTEGYLAESRSKIYDSIKKVYTENDKTIYQYDSNNFIKSIVNYSFHKASNDFYIKTKTTFFYDSKKNISGIDEYKGDITNGLHLSFKYNYEYDSLNRKVFYKYCEWNRDRGEFNNCSSYELIYNIERSVFACFASSLYSKDAGWKPSYKEQYFYDGQIKLWEVSNRKDIHLIGRASKNLVLREYIQQGFGKNDYEKQIKVVYYYSKSKLIQRITHFLKSFRK